MNRNRSALAGRPVLPVVLIGGPQSELRDGLIAQARAGAVGHEPWGLIRSPRLTAGSDHVAEEPVTQLGACACCTGSVALLTAYTKLHRSHGPLRGLIIEFDARAYVCAIIDALRGDALRESGLALHSVWHARSRWSTEPVDERAQQMIAAADRLWLTGSGQLAGIVQYLHDHYWNDAILVEGPNPPDWRLPDSTQSLAAGSGCWQRSDESWTLLARSEAGVWWRWRTSATRVFRRSRLQSVLPDLARIAPLRAARGAFRTEREWYGWRLGGDWTPSFWRRDSRLDILLDADAPDAAWERALNSCAD